MAFVGEAFLSAFIEVVIDRLASPEFVNLIRGKKLDDNLLQRLKNTLYAVEAVLNDAEQKQIKDSAVNKWLDDLKDVVYDADDLLDHISTKAATQKKEVSTTSTSFFSRFFNYQGSDREMVNMLEDVVGRLESIFKLKDILGLKEIARENSSWRTPSTSLEDRFNIYGRDGDKEAILKLLLDDEKGDGKTSVIPIVGMGGVGKTTLAQSVYNDDNIKKKFDLQAWVCVSDEFDVLKVTKTILEEITRSACGIHGINSLHLDLKEKLTGKKFLIVFDDVWTEDYDGWNFLMRPLQYGAAGSKIIVTTRSDKVASMVQTLQGYHRLGQLSDEDCWSVFANHACLSSESNDSTDLQKIGREIVRKCKGLPLAAQSLGGLLRGKDDIADWKNVLNSNIWEISENESKIIPALRISYHHLPPYVKRCFVYCALYPKDYEFNKDELILLWMAEDLLRPPKSGKTVEEVGHEYFNFLASRSFFQRHTGYWGGKCFVMHDLVHDLATSLGGEFYFRTEELGKETKTGSKTRHLSFSRLSDPISQKFEIFGGGVKSLRTFLPISLREASCSIEKAPWVVLSGLKRLRVLSFRRFRGLDALPDSIGEWTHLRYLDLSFTDIETLPESLCNLYNLQTLKLCHCEYLTMLPNDMQNLVKLRHLDISGTIALKEMPREMSKLNHLRRLSDFIVGKHEEKGIKQLGTLSNLQGSLSIEKLENVTNCCEALEARIMDKEHLEELQLKWGSGDNFDNSQGEMEILDNLDNSQGEMEILDNLDNSQGEMEILDNLKPPPNLKRLTINGYRGTRFAEWVGHPSYHNMTRLSLSRCRNCWTLPSLGQLPSLKQLNISKLFKLQSIGYEFFKNGDSFSGKPFPSLEDLWFEHMSSWEVWHHPVESDAFPVLKSLKIRDCPSLRGDLPTHLPSLETISITNCGQLASSIPRAPAIRQLHIVGSNKVALRELPLSVEGISIGGEQQVEFVLEAIAVTLPTSLRSLDIWGCSSAISFPGDCLPASLEILHIVECRKLVFPNQNHLHESLQQLYIYGSCDSLTTLSLDKLLNLQGLKINNCENLESLSVSNILHNLNDFAIFECPNFVSFPREGLSAPNLTSLKVKNCINLRSLPCHANTLLPKLEGVTIGGCPEIETFPEGGMPPSLRSLDIRNCEKLLRSPSLTSLDMLTSLTIEGPCDGVECFPEEGLALLPPSLTTLRLLCFSSLHTLQCTRLLHLTSLQHLILSECPKLENMEGERLPTSLIYLAIFQCPLLAERCRMKHPQIWPKISHIRRIKVEDYGWEWDRWTWT